MEALTAEYHNGRVDTFDVLTGDYVHQLQDRSVFFFQAEDGIRDLTVTGVQTCALPICAVPTLPISLDFSGTSALADGNPSLLQLTNNDGSAKGTLDSFNIGVDGVITDRKSVV